MSLCESGKRNKTTAGKYVVFFVSIFVGFCKILLMCVKGIPRFEKKRTVRHRIPKEAKLFTQTYVVPNRINIRGNASGEVRAIFEEYHQESVRKIRTSHVHPA